MIAFISIVLLLATTAGIMLLEAWILSLLWNWILVNTFALHIPSLTIWTALGVICLINIVAGKFKVPVDKD